MKQELTELCKSVEIPVEGVGVCRSKEDCQHKQEVSGVKICMDYMERYYVKLLYKKR